MLRENSISNNLRPFFSQLTRTFQQAKMTGRYINLHLVHVIESELHGYNFKEVGPVLQQKIYR